MRIFIIDDDEIFLFLTKKAISSAIISGEIADFEQGETALDFLKKNLANPELLPDFIFLDLNMPVMDGWEFLEEYSKIAPLVEKKICLFVLSSSISPYDVDKAKKNELVSDFLVKPLTKEILSDIFTRYGD